MRFVWRRTRANRQVILSGSNVGGRSADRCCFEHGEWYLRCLDVKAGMFRNSHERNRAFANDHLFALHRGDVAG